MHVSSPSPKAHRGQVKDEVNPGNMVERSSCLWRRDWWYLFSRGLYINSLLQNLETVVDHGRSLPPTSLHLVVLFQCCTTVSCMLVCPISHPVDLRYIKCGPFQLQDIGARQSVGS